MEGPPTSMTEVGVPPAANEGEPDTKVVMMEVELEPPVVPLTELLEADAASKEKDHTIREPVVWSHCYALAVLLLLLMAPATGVSNFLSTPPGHWPWEEVHADLGTLGSGVSDWEIHHHAKNQTLPPWSPPPSPSRPPKSLFASHQHREAHRPPPMSSS